MLQRDAQLSGCLIIAELADDTKLGGAVDFLEGQEALQRDLDKLEHWAIISGMKCNKTQCQILPLGWSHTGHRYKLGEQPCRKGSGGAG